MTRQIKFRAWDKTKNYFVRSGHCVEFDGSVHEYRMGAVIPRLNEVELNQWTGLQDKNGKEIYEGDKIKIYDTNRGCDHDEEIGDNVCEEDMYLCTQVVKFENCGYFCSETIGDYCPPLNEDYLVLEVIGNIYESPNLIK